MGHELLAVRRFAALVVTADQPKALLIKYELDLARLRSRDNEELLHRNAFNTVNGFLLNDDPVRQTIRFS